MNIVKKWEQGMGPGVEGSNPFSPTIYLLINNLFLISYFKITICLIEIFSITPGGQKIIMC